MSSAPCPACAAPARATEGPYRVCPGCGLRFAWPLVAADAAWYARSGLYTDEGPGDPRDPRHAACLARVAPGRLLDLGCGAGAFLRRARDAGFEVSGVEFQELLAARARAVGLEVQVGDVTQALERGGRTHDVVTAFDVLEHLADPAAVARAMLARGRQVVVSVPRADRRPAEFDPTIDAPPHHLTLWTPVALRELFDRAGARTCAVVELPLTAHERHLHHLWRRHGHGAIRTDRLDGLVKRGLALRVAVRRAFGLARGQTLMAFASA